MHANLVDHGFHGLVDIANHAQTNDSRILGQSIVKSVNVLATQTGFGCNLLEGRAGTHPKLAVAGVGVELLGRTGSAGLEVQHCLVTAFGKGFKDNH